MLVPITKAACGHLGAAQSWETPMVFGNVTPPHPAPHRWLGRLTRRMLVPALAALALGASALAAEPPIRIGFGMALTGPLAANGKMSLLAMQIWRDDVNAKGGLLGRKVELVYYDDQSSPAAVPGINAEFKYDKYFSMLPTGPTPRPTFTKHMFTVATAQNPKPQTVAIVSVDAEFGRNACEGARDNAKEAKLKIVYDRSYPPTTTDFTPIVRAVQAANPDVVVICSYPLDTVGLVKAIHEVGYKPKMIGGAMVGLQATVFKTQLGPLLNEIGRA